MSVCNMGATVGSLLYGSVSGITNWSQNYAVMGLIVFLILLSLLMYRTGGHPEKLLGTEKADTRHIREIHRH